MEVVECDDRQNILKRALEKESEDLKCERHHKVFYII
jgi:hypothetical protein